MKTIRYTFNDDGGVFTLVDGTAYIFVYNVPQELSDAHANELLLNGVFEEVIE